MSSLDDTVRHLTLISGYAPRHTDAVAGIPLDGLISALIPAVIITGVLFLLLVLIFTPWLSWMSWMPNRLRLGTLVHLRTRLRPLARLKDRPASHWQVTSDVHTNRTTRPALRPAFRPALISKMPGALTKSFAAHSFRADAEAERMTEQLRQSQAALWQSEAKYRGLVEQIPVVVYEADLDDVLTTTYISPVVEELLGYPAQAWIRNPAFWYEHVHPEDRLKLKHATLNQTSDRAHLTSEYRLTARDGRTVWVRDEGRVIRDAATGRVYLQGAMLDITARKAAEEQLRYVNEHDTLTGLYNRAYFEAALEQLEARLETQPALEVAFVIIDVNALKTTNDAHGHARGDALLRQLTQVLEATAEAIDADHVASAGVSGLLNRGENGEILLARIAGDEFVMVLTGPLAAQVEPAMAEIQRRIAQEQSRPGAPLPHLSVAVGSAVRQPDELLTQTLQKADRAMYQDKVLHRPLHTLERLLGPRLNLLLNHTRNIDIASLTHNLQIAGDQTAQQLQKMQQIEATYQQFIEQLPVTTYISLPDAENSMLYVSPQIESILGYTPQEFLKQPDLWTQRIHPDDRDRVVTACRTAYQQATSYEMEYRMITRQGGRVFIHDEFWPIFDEQGHLSYVQGVMMDISARNLAEERSKAFSELGAQLSATTDVSQAADIILQVAEQLLDCDAASISLSSVEDQTLLQTLLMIDTRDGQRHTVRNHETRLLPGSLLQQVLEDGRGVMLNPDEIAKWDLRPFGEAERPPHSVLLVPVRNGSRTIGLISIQSYKTHTYTETDLDTLQALAGHCGGALERIWAEQMLRNQQVTLQTISNAVSGRMNLAETLNDICRRVNQQLGTDAAGIVLLSADGTRLACAGSDGFNVSQIPASIPVEGTCAGQAIREQRTVHVEDFEFYVSGGNRSPSYQMMRSQRYEDVTHATPEPNVAYLGVPLFMNDRPAGVLELFRYVGFPTHSQWQSFLQSLAHQVSVAISSAQLFEDVQRVNLELAQAYGSTIEGWSRALDMRDKETEGHSQRVTEMSVRLAAAFGLDAEQIKHVRYGALLHDIGKLVIPDDILFNVGPLTQDQWAVMRRHPEYAREMLANVEYLKPALDIPYSHHERWDGSGYPLGLKGEQIPLAARIFAVVDVWDALRSSRRYREGLPDITVLEYLRSAAGVHLDPQVVDRFLQLLESQTEM